MKKLFLIIILSVSVITESDAQWNNPFDWFGKTSFSPEASQYFNRITDKPSVDTLRFYSEYIDSLVANGLWAKIDRLHVRAARNQQMALLDMKGGTVNTNVNSMTFTVYKGFTGDASTSYINTNYNPAVHGVTYTLNSAIYGIYIGNDIAANGMADIGVVNSDNTNRTINMNVRAATGSNAWSINQGNSNQTSMVASTLGLFTVRRSTSSTQTLWFNGVQVGSGSVSSTSIENGNVFVGARNQGGSAAAFSNRLIQLDVIGGGWTDQDIINFKNCTERLMDKLGAGVIP